jgi:hypothetical protein
MKHKNLTKQIVKLNRNQKMGAEGIFPRRKETSRHQRPMKKKKKKQTLLQFTVSSVGWKLNRHVSARAHHPDTWRSIMISTRWDQVHTEKRNGSEDKLRSIMISCQVQKKKEWVRR